MKTTFAALVFTLLFATAASAQQTRETLNAPGKVPWGTSYEQAQTLLGPEAIPQGIAVGPNLKSLQCYECLPLKDAELIVLYFLDGVGLVSIEVHYEQGDYPNLAACEKDETDVMPELVAQYGKPNSTESKRKQQNQSSFEFADGSLIEYTLTFIPEQTMTVPLIIPFTGGQTVTVKQSCSLKVEYMNKAGAELPD